MSKLKWGVVQISVIALVFLLSLFSGRTPSVFGQVSTTKDKPKFVPNEVIVRYKPGQSPQDLEQNVLVRKERQKTVAGKFQNWRENVTVQVSGQELPETKLQRVKNIQIQTGVIEEKKLFSSLVLGAENGKDIPLSLQGFMLYQTDGRKSVDDLVAEYKKLPEVQVVEPNWLWYALDTVPNDALYPKMWALEKIQIKKAWDITKGSSSVTVAVIDTGVNYNHEDFAGRTFVDGYDFATYCLEYNSNYPYNCVRQKERNTDPMDEEGHGTHVAGTIGAVTNNNLGVSGINWNVKIMPLRVLGPGGRGNVADVTDAIKYAADKGAKVINMSLGGPPACAGDSLAQTAIDYAYGKGVTVVVAAGNDSEDTAKTSPSGCNHVINVAAVEFADKRAPYSSFGVKVDLAAPGGSQPYKECDGICTCEPTTSRCYTGYCGDSSCVLSTYLQETQYDPKYKTEMGTSMACPHVAGVVALMLSVNSNLTPDQVESILKNQNNTDPLTTETDKPIGRRLNAYKAVLAASGINLSTPTPTTTSIPVATHTLTPTATKTPTPTGTVPVASPTPTPTNPAGVTITPSLTSTLTPTPNPCSCPSGVPPKSLGNANCDSAVNILDFQIWILERWGKLASKTGDFDCSGIVDLSDFQSWIMGRWGL